MKILSIPTKTLRERSKEVDREFVLQPSTQAFIDQLIVKMYEDDGIGIAAPQVGTNIRICIIGKEALPKGFVIPGIAEHKKIDFALINPEWERTSKKMGWDTEGCLSVPKVYGKVQRHKDIMVNAMDRNGNSMSFQANNFLARVIQHEIDHLNGILFIDRAIDIYTIDEVTPRERLQLVRDQEHHRL